MTDVDVVPLVDEGLGNSAHLLDLELGTVTTRADLAPAGPTVVMCGHEEGEMSGASVLARAGRTDLAVLDGGLGGWVTATGETPKVGA